MSMEGARVDKNITTTYDHGRALEEQQRVERQNEATRQQSRSKESVRSDVIARMERTCRANNEAISSRGRATNVVNGGSRRWGTYILPAERDRNVHATQRATR